MDEEPDPIRDIVYERLGQTTEEEIQSIFLRGEGPRLVAEIVRHCAGKIEGLPGDGDEKTAAMATVLMHYLCTVLLVPTQRKTEMDGVHVDIAIPDTRTLKTNWNSGIVLCILVSTERGYVERRIAEAKKVQPNQENIWIIAPRPVDSDHTTFVIDSEECSFSRIIGSINEFLDKNRSARFKIFKAT